MTLSTPFPPSVTNHPPPLPTQRGISEKRFGQPPYPDHKYDDVADISAILSLPDSAVHRDIDKFVQAAASSAVRTAIVSPPTIYGTGRGPGNTRSMQVPGMVGFALTQGFAPVIGTGLTEGDHVHVGDLAGLIVRLVSASQDDALNGDPEVFGERSYFFAEAGAHRWGDVAKCKPSPKPQPSLSRLPKTDVRSDEMGD